MEFDLEFTPRGFFRPLLTFDGPPTIDLHIHWKLCRRVFYRTYQGILPPTADDAIDAFSSSHFGFSLRPFSEFRQQVLMSITTDLDFPSALSDSVSDQISSSVNDLLDESFIGLYPHLIVVAEINVVHNVYVDYDPIPLEIIPHLEIIQPRQLASSENTIPDTTTEDPEVDDIRASMDDTFMRRPAESWGGDEEDIDSLYENFIHVRLSEDEEDNNAGTEMLERIERGKWTMGGEEGEVICSVCLDELSEGQEVMTTACQHSYHEQCLLPWLIRNQTCPLCRRPV